MSQDEKQRIAEYFHANRDRCQKTLELFSMFANETRFKILCILAEHDFCVNDLVEIIDAKHSNVSQQLKMLRLSGYVTKKRDGKSIIYHLENEDVRTAISFIQTELYT